MPISTGTTLPKQVKIMFMGDSLTVGGTGADTIAYGGYRNALTAGIIARIGARACFVGSQSSSAGVYCGANGQTIAQITADPYATVQLAQYLPDVIFLHIGTNDSTQLQSGGSPTLATSRANLTTLLNLIRSTVPNCIVHICRIIDNSTAHTQVTDFNTNAIDTDVVARSDYSTHLVRIVDMYTAVGLYSATQYFDLTHVNGVGYALEVTAWQTSFNLDF